MHLRVRMEATSLMVVAAKIKGVSLEFVQIGRLFIVVRLRSLYADKELVIIRIAI